MKIFSTVFFSLVVLQALCQDNYEKEKKTGHDYGVIKNLQTQKKSLNFLVMGDWGRHGEFYQKQVAAQMASAVEGLGASFIIATGDNFYPKGVAGINDPSWQSSFENVYTQHPLFNDWYIVLGNHDYKTNPEAEVEYSKISARWHMPARYYKIEKRIDKNNVADFFFIDTSPFQKGYYSDEDYGPHVQGIDTTAQKLWLENELQKSKATWKFVVGHHNIISAGKRKDKPNDIYYSITPILEKYKVDAYLCGHEHHLEYDNMNLYDSSFHFVQFISGAASEATEVSEAHYAKFAAQQFGFLGVSITAETALFQYIDWQGNILYSTTLNK